MTHQAEGIAQLQASVGGLWRAQNVPCTSNGSIAGLRRTCHWTATPASTDSPVGTTPSETCHFKKAVSISQTVMCGLNASYSSLELVFWNSDVGFAVSSLYELIDGHNLTLQAIEEASTELVAPRRCCIGAICAVVITRVGAWLQIKYVHLKANAVFELLTALQIETCESVHMGWLLTGMQVPYHERCHVAVDFRMQAREYYATSSSGCGGFRMSRRCWTPPFRCVACQFSDLNDIPRLCTTDIDGACNKRGAFNSGLSGQTQQYQCWRLSIAIRIAFFDSKRKDSARRVYDCDAGQKIYLCSSSSYLWSGLKV